MSKNNPYRPIKTEVLDVITETPTIRTLKLKPDEEITFKTGQFIELTIPGIGEAPFTPSSRPAIKDSFCPSRDPPTSPSTHGGRATMG